MLGWDWFYNGIYLKRAEYCRNVFESTHASGIYDVKNAKAILLDQMKNKVRRVL